MGLIGYARVSTAEGRQVLDRQLDALNGAGCERVLEDPAHPPHDRLSHAAGAQIGLYKGEAHHALKNALRIGHQGEIRDRSTEGQHHRMAGLNLLAASVIYWNTGRPGEAVANGRRAGMAVSPELRTPNSVWKGRARGKSEIEPLTEAYTMRGKREMGRN